MILLSGAIFCAGHFVERRESMQTNNKMAVAPVGKLIWQMSIPPLISMFLQYSYNLIDSAFVARLSENALTAVSLSFPITTLMNATSIWIGVGVNVLIAGYLGQKKQDEANTTVTHGLLLAFGIGALLNLLSLLIMKLYFRAFTNNEEIYQLSMAYMSVCSFMQIPNMAHIAIQKMMQATGNMVAPMCFQIAGVVVNFVFDRLLIFGIGVFPAMGIRGAAVATVAGYLLSMILAFALLLGKKQKVRIKIKGFHLQKWLIGRIFTLGLPSFIMNALSSFMVTFVNFFLVAYSDTAIAFFGAYFKVQQLIVMTVNGLIQGCLPIMRFNYGAGNRDRLHSAFRYGTALVSGMMILGTLTVILFPAQLLGLFTASEAIALLWNIRYADYGGQLPVLRMVYHDLHLSSGNRTGLSKYTDPATASVSAAHSIHVGSGKTPEDYRDLAVLPCHRNGNIRSGASDLPSRQKKRNALQRYKNTVRTGKGETIWKYILKKGWMLCKQKPYFAFYHRPYGHATERKKQLWSHGNTLSAMEPIPPTENKSDLQE